MRPRAPCPQRPYGRESATRAPGTRRTPATPQNPTLRWRSAGQGRLADSDGGALRQLLSDELLPRRELLGRLVAQDAAAPPDLGPLVEHVAARLGDLGELALVLVPHGRQAQGRGVLLVHYGPQPRLALDDAVRHAHLLAQRGQPHHQLHGVHVVRNHHQLRLLGLDQLRHVVDPELDLHGLGLLGGLPGGLRLGLLLQAGLLGRLVLRPVLRQQPEERLRRVLVQRPGELEERRGHLQPLQQDPLLALDAHVARPLDEPAHIALGRQRLADPKGLGPPLVQGVGLGFGRLGLGHRVLCHLLRGHFQRRGGHEKGRGGIAGPAIADPGGCCAGTRCQGRGLGPSPRFAARHVRYAMLEGFRAARAKKRSRGAATSSCETSAGWRKRDLAGKLTGPHLQLARCSSVGAWE